MLKLTNPSDLLNFLQSNRNIPYVNPSQKKNGMPMPKLMNFINKTMPPENWYWLESYMLINGEKIKESFPENKKLTDKTCLYRLGVILEKKKNDRFIFTTYTIFEGTCVFNHKSVHKLNGNLLFGSVNLFDQVSNFECYDGTDGDVYVNQIIKELDKNRPNFSWDIIKS